MEDEFNSFPKGNMKTTSMETLRQPYFVGENRK
jgi:hypothetical protein